MSERDTTAIGDESGSGPEHGIAKRGRESLSRALQSLRTHLRSGIPAGVGGGVSLLNGVRALRRGDRERGFRRFAVGGLLVGIGLAQRRSMGDRDGDRTAVDLTDVVRTGPDIEDLEQRESGGGHHASGGDAQRVAGTSIDIEDAGSSPELDTDADATDVDQTDVAETGVDGDRLADAATESGAATDTETADETDAVEPQPDVAETEPDVTTPESSERLGAAAFDEHSNEIPVPQRAFNQNLLSLGSEAFWGIREDDDAVFVSREFDPLEDGDGIQYVASSEIDGDRMLTIPDAVLDHWDIVAGGGMAVAGGDDIVFVTSDELQTDEQVRLVPEQWADDVLEDGE